MGLMWEHWHVDMKTAGWGCKGGPGPTHCWSPGSPLICSHPPSDQPSRAMQCSRCWDASWGPHWTKFHPRITFCVFTRPQTESSLKTEVTVHLSWADTSRTEEPGELQSMGCQSQTVWRDSADTQHSEKQDSGRQGDYTLYGTGPKSSISSLPSFSPVLAHLLGCKQICEHLSFHRCPSARSQTWADSAFLQPCSFSWAPFWPAFWGMKPATSSRVHPSSPLPYRLEGKGVSAWKGWEEGFGGCCQPSLDFFSKWAVELQYIFVSQKVSICVLLLIKLSHLMFFFSKSWISSLRLSIPSLYLVPKCHLG